MATKGKQQQKDDWESAPKSHAPGGGSAAVDDWEEKKNPSDQRAAGPESWGHYLARSAFRAVNPLGAAVTEYAGGDTPTVMAHAANTALLKNPEYLPAVKEYLASSERENPGSATLGKALGYVGLGAAQAALPGSFLAQTGAAGAQGLLTKPEGNMAPDEDIVARAQQGGLSALLAGSLLGAGKAAGKGGDWLMQRAVGRTKYTPGVGTTLANEGIVGTENAMRGQVRAAKEKAFEEMLQATAGNPAVYDSMPVAQQVLNVARSKQVPGASASPLDQPYINEVSRGAMDIGSRGLETLSQMLRRRAAAGARAFSNVTDAAKQGVLADISKAEQIGYSKLLKNAAPELIPIDARYAALAKAAHGLKPEQRISQAGNVMRPPATMWGTVLDFLPSSLVESLLGQAMVKGSQAAPVVIPAAVGTMRQGGQ